MLVYAKQKLLKKMNEEGFFYSILLNFDLHEKKAFFFRLY